MFKDGGEVTELLWDKGNTVETCVVFEDSRNGLLAGANGGFPVIVVPDLFDPTLELPGLCYAKCARLDEAIDVIQNS